MIETGPTSAVVLIAVLIGVTAIIGTLLGRFVLGLLIGILAGLALATTPAGSWINEQTTPAISASWQHITNWLASR